MLLLLFIRQYSFVKNSNLRKVTNLYTSTQVNRLDRNSNHNFYIDFSEIGILAVLVKDFYKDIVNYKEPALDFWRQSCLKSEKMSDDMTRYNVIQ